MDVGVAVEGRVGLFQAQGLAWLTGARSELQLHAAAEASFRGEVISPFVQARLDSRPGCPPSESPLCGTGGAAVAGLRGSFDAASASPFAGVGHGSGHASVLVGVQTGLSFDVDFVRRHGDGSAEAQAWWERRAASLRSSWGEQFAEREYGALEEQLRSQRAALWRSLDERPSTHLGELPQPEDALRLFHHAVLGEDAALQDLLREPLAASTIAELRHALVERRTQSAARLYGSSRRKPPLRRNAEGTPQLALGDAAITWERLIREQGALLQELERERRQREEAQRIPYRPLVLPPMEKIALNAAALAPFELLAAFYMGSPEGVEQMAVIRRDLRSHLLPYTEEEREVGEAMEAAYQTLFSVGISLTGGASRAPALAARRDAVRALQTELATVITRAEPAAATEGLLTRLGNRLNPFNYAFDGLGSNFGNVRFRPSSGNLGAMNEKGVFEHAATALGEEPIDAAKLGAQAKAERVGRAKNHLRPDPSADGPHTTFRRDERGEVSHYVEWEPNPRHPGGFDERKRVDVVGKAHQNPKTGELVSTPHTHDKRAPGGVRRAEPDEIPASSSNRTP